MTRWEYKTAEYLRRRWKDLSAHLNRLGEDGWELVAIEDRNKEKALMIFKRPRQEDES